MAYLTLADYAASPKPLMAGVADVLRHASPIMDMLPFVNTGSLSVETLRQAALPSISWRKAGESHGSGKGRVDLVKEQAYSFGNYIDVDKVYVKQDNSLYDARALWTKQTVTSMAFEFNNQFINGDPTAGDPDVLPGLFWRIKYDLAAAQAVDAGGIDITTAVTAANIQAMLDKLDALLYEMPEGQADALIMNRQAYLRLQSLFRQSNALPNTTNKLGLTVPSYRGAMLIDAGMKQDQASQIIGNVELANGTALTGGTFSSIYAVRFGTEYLTGWQEYGLEVDDLGLLNDCVTYRTIVDWVIGLGITHPRSVARLYDIKAV